MPLGRAMWFAMRMFIGNDNSDVNCFACGAPMFSVDDHLFERWHEDNFSLESDVIFYDERLTV